MAATDCVPWPAGWTLVEIETGAMYPICVINDCSDSLDIWQYVLSFFSLYHLSPAPQNDGKPKCDHAIKFASSSLTSHLSMVWAFPLQGTTELLNGISFFCLKAFNTLPLAYTVCRTIMGGSRYDH